MKNATAWTQNVTVTSCLFILPSHHFLIVSSQAATALHYKQLPRFKVSQALLYEKAAIDGNSEGLYVKTSPEPVGHAAPIISIHLQALGLKLPCTMLVCMEEIPFIGTF